VLFGERRFISLSLPARGQDPGCPPTVGRRIRDARRPSAVGSRVPGPGPAALLAASREGGGPGWAAAAPTGEAPNGRGRGTEPGSTESPSELRQTRGGAPRAPLCCAPPSRPVPGSPRAPGCPGRAPSSPRSLRSSRAPGCPERAPCAARRAGLVRTPRVHRDPGTARRGSGRRGGGGRRYCWVDHPTRLKVPAGGLGRRGGGLALRAEVAGPAGHCPRSSAASLRPLLAVLGGVRTWAQSPLRLKRRRTPGPAPFRSRGRPGGRQSHRPPPGLCSPGHRLRRHRRWLLAVRSSAVQLFFAF
jgi:hypothetical protein